MLKRLLALVLAGAMALSMVACSTPAASTEGEGESEGPRTNFRYSALSEVPTLDPQLANSVPSNTTILHIQEPLVRMYNGVLEPGMAETWDISPDGLTYTFHLRDAVWSDGVAVTAYDFEYGIKRLVDPATASPYAWFACYIKNGTPCAYEGLSLDELGVKALDEKTLEITLEYAADYFLQVISSACYTATRKDLVDQYGQDFAATAEKNVYSGPFVVKEVKTGDRLILAKNPNYWNADQTKLEEVEIIVVANANTAVDMYNAGDLDYVEVPSDLKDLYADQISEFYDGSNDFLRIKQDDPNVPTHNKDLRLAINYAINRAEFITLTSNDVYAANPRYVLPQVAGVEKTYGEEYPYEAFPVNGDSEKAQAHLAAALEALGCEAGDIELELLTTDTENSKKQAEVLQQQIQEELGIVITIKQVPYKDRLKMESERDFELVFTGWAPDYSDPYTYLELQISDAAYNYGGYNLDFDGNVIDSTFDDLMEFAATTTDKQARMDALFEAEKTMLEDAAVVPLLLRRVLYMQNENLEGLNLYFLGARVDFTRAYWAE
ncbi:MAG: peptide ABC transporter substrate-binding protein [Oscillospiraceae bacterium]|nr:peptide ABC transporter substrate-binding protein [Oscillospiraceae bacterium]